jgi:electron transport complex protein RnfD
MSDDFYKAMKKVYGSERTVDTPDTVDKTVTKKDKGKKPNNVHNHKVAAVLKKIYGSNGFPSDKFKEVNKITSKDAKLIEEEVKEEIKEKKIEKPRELIISINPHIKDNRNVSKIMWAVVIALLPTTIAGIYFFKFNALWVILLSVAAAIGTEYLICRLSKKKNTISDGSAVITGLLLALILPPGVPLWVPVFGAIFAISIGKMVFGGLGHNIFNPALVGRVFLAASFPNIMTTWILPDGVTGATPLGLLKLEGIKTSYMQLFLGNVGGSIGETSAIALLVGAAFLFYMKIIDWRIPATYIGTIALGALIFGQDPLFHILAGGLLIGALFMATDYVTSPLSKNGKLIFGFGCGFLTIILRLFSGYPEGVMFAILLMNTATPLIDRFTKTKSFGYVCKRQKKKNEKEKIEEKQIKSKVDEMLKDENQ